MNRTKSILFFGIIISSFLFSSIPSYAQTLRQKEVSELDSLWNRSVATYLRDSLWLKRDLYDAGHFLMIPLHSSFKINNKTWKTEFSNHFERFTDNSKHIDDVTLNKLHYYYLISQFIVLSKQNDEYPELSNKLFHLLYKEINNLWNHEKAWQWTHPKWRKVPFSSMRERIYWKLDNEIIEKNTFHNAIIDAELFTIAIAADLKFYLHLSKKENSILLDDIVKTGVYIYKKRVVWSQEKSSWFNNVKAWVFQPGVWYNHRDYKYAGNSILQKELTPKLKEGIAEDTSHSHRTALWLKSLENAYISNKKNKHYFAALIRGLEKQFIENVLVAPNASYPYYRTNNYMDGHNGVYRYNYATLGENGGYGAYELTGTFYIGWWSFLGTKRIKKVYKHIGKSYPLDDHLIELIQSKSGRIKNPIVEDKNTNGLIELISKLSGL